jgi:hypothetical protein
MTALRREPSAFDGAGDMAVRGDGKHGAYNALFFATEVAVSRRVVVDRLEQESVGERVEDAIGYENVKMDVDVAAACTWLAWRFACSRRPRAE